VPPFVRGTSTSWAPSQPRGLAFPLGSPAPGRVPPRYRRFLTTTGPAVTLWPSALSPAPTLLRRLSLRDQEGFARFRCNPSLRAVATTPLGPAAVSASLPRSVLPSPRFHRLGTQRSLLSRLAQRSLPTARKVAPWPYAKFVRRLRPRLSPAKRLLSFVSLALLTAGLSPTGLHRLLVTRKRTTKTETCHREWTGPAVSLLPGNSFLLNSIAVNARHRRVTTPSQASRHLTARSVRNSVPWRMSEPGQKRSYHSFTDLLA